MFDFPLPFRPVIALKNGSNPLTSVRCAYDLKPSITNDLMYMILCNGDDSYNENNFNKMTVEIKWNFTNYRW